MKRLKSTGVMQRLENLWVRRDKLVEIYTPKSPQVTMDHIIGILILYLIVILTSLMILLIEIIYFKRKQLTRK